MNQDRNEVDAGVCCALCGADVSPGSDRSFSFAAEQVLCWDCAERRGGVYDAIHERWETAPETDDLLEPPR